MHSSPVSSPSRRLFLRRSATTAAITTGTVSIGAHASILSSGEPVVETTLGKIRGRASQGVAAFKGIPYAASTEGANRFMPPARRQPWAGVRDAFEHGASAPQPQGGSPAEFAWYWPKQPISEDCLSLAIYTPGVNDNKRRPVLVWLHGGAFSIGAGTSDGFDGSHLAKSQDVVVITINHRLNVFGSFFIEGIERHFSDASANIAALDQIAALQWIRENVQSFGGNPDNVTIFGQSGGAAKVTALMGTPTARGLFHKAIVQSGSGLWKLASRDNAARAGHALLKVLDLNPSEAYRLRDVPLAQLIGAFGKVAGANGGVSEFRPTLDGVMFRDEPFDPAATALAANIPLLIGTTSDEATFFLAGDQKNFSLGQEQVERRIQRFIGLDAAGTKHLIDAYRSQYPHATPSQLLIAIAGDYNYRLPTMAVADRQAATAKAPVYAYEFNWQSPSRQGVLGAAHTAEVPFIFGTLDAARALVQTAPDQLQVRDRMGAIWGQFARTGNPNSADNGLGNWGAYQAGTRTTATLGGTWEVKQDRVAHARAAFSQVPLYEYSFPVSFTRD